MLTREEVGKFKRLALEVYGIKLTDAEAIDQGGRLIQLFELILKNKMTQNDTIANFRRKSQNDR